MSETNSPRKEGLLEEAAAWFARMRGPDADAEREEFEKWLARGALHRAAYNRAAEVFAMGKVLADDHTSDQVIAPEQRRPNKPVEIASCAALFAVVLAAGTSIVHEHSSRGVETADRYGSAASSGQVAELSASANPQFVRFADNSEVRLASSSTLGVQFSKAERRLVLERGSARFFVAHEGRPFIVDAGGGYVVAHGTVFDVGLSADQQVKVHLLQGVVDVTPPRRDKSAHNPAPKRLHAGQAISFAALPMSTVSMSNGSQVDAQQVANAGQLREFDGISLRELAALANKGAVRPIRLADDRTADLRVSGRFRIDDTQLLADRIAELFNVIVDRSRPGEIVLKAR